MEENIQQTNEEEGVTLHDVLDSINKFATKTEIRFGNIESQISGVKQDVVSIKQDVVSIKSQMVTKDYLDKKVAETRGDLIALTRKEDERVTAVIKTLGSKQVLDEKEVQQLNNMRVLTPTS